MTAEVERLPSKAVAELLARVDAGEGDRLSLGGRGVVVRLDAGEVGEVVVKLDVPPTRRQRLGARLRGTRAQRAADAAAALRARGVPVAEVLAVVDDPQRSVLVTRYVPGVTLSEALANADPKRQHDLARAAASLAASLAGHGFVFRDLKPPNVLVSGADALVPIDLADVRVRSRAPDRTAWRSLAALDAYAQLGPRPLGVRARRSALRDYCAARGLDERQVLRCVLPLAREKRARLERRLGER